MNLTLRQLRYFDAVARHGHFGRAAEASGVSQPALSVQVKELETELGARLFERGPRQVRLTAFGETFAGRARAILRAVDELGELARVSKGGLSGRLRLGVIPTVAPYLLPRVVTALGGTWPALDLEIRETVTPNLLDALAEGALDAAILALPSSDRRLEEAPLLSEDFVLVRPAAEADQPVPAPEALHEMRLLLLEEGHCFRDQALAVCTGGVRERHGLEGSALSTLVQMVGAGLGVTLIPEMAVAVEARAAPVAVQRFPAPAPGRRLGLAWRRSTPLAPELRHVAEVLRTALSAPA
ncbi:hydrogen peroxide-inducible genes activator [Jannaschia formosa]|uniref:hydrogen peroxide-inducible genes activator n=1 Tax=Jannaschia formosa TaxID=2259592 RepID=UPI000E1BF3A3|nr:hydrogen peroxide-inducible genes activator [Jannaschia formosa]TFL17519.1 hydrogen peroxide-inducible genes activator [Jannaschia formosa]